MFEKKPNFFCASPRQPKGKGAKSPYFAPQPGQKALYFPHQRAEQQEIGHRAQKDGHKGVDLYLAPCGGDGVDQNTPAHAAPEQHVQRRRPHPAPPPQTEEPQQVVKGPDAKAQHKPAPEDGGLDNGVVAQAQGRTHRNSRLKKPPPSSALSS